MNYSRERDCQCVRWTEIKDVKVGDFYSITTLGVHKAQRYKTLEGPFHFAYLNENDVA